MTTNGKEWKRVTTNNSEWYKECQRVVQRMKTNESDLRVQIQIIYKLGD